MSKITRHWNGLFWVESTDGTSVDLSKYAKKYTIYDKDGNVISEGYSDKYLDELDNRYEKVLADIVTKSP